MQFVGKKLECMGIFLFGVVFFDKILLFFIMEMVNEVVGGWVVFNGYCFNNWVEDIMVGLLVDFNEFSVFWNIFLVVSYKCFNEAIEKVKYIVKVKNLKCILLFGVIVIGDGKQANWYKFEEMEYFYFIKNEILVIMIQFDIYGLVVKVSCIEVKINICMFWKIKWVIILICEYVNFDLMIEELQKLS